MIHGQSFSSSIHQSQNDYSEKNVLRLWSKANGRSSSIHQSQNDYSEKSFKIVIQGKRSLQLDAFNFSAFQGKWSLQFNPSKPKWLFRKERFKIVIQGKRSLQFDAFNFDAFQGKWSLQFNPSKPK